MRHAQEKYRPPPSVHAFDQMMTASRAINKPPRRKDQEASRFTGDALEGVVNVWLQYTYRFCILRLYPFAACAFCAAVGATKDKEALKTHHILLPVCRDCIIIGKLPPKRNPIKSYRDFTLREMNQTPKNPRSNPSPGDSAPSARRSRLLSPYRRATRR